MMNKHLTIVLLAALGTACAPFEMPPQDIDCPADAPADPRVVGSASAWLVPGELGNTVHVEGRSRHLDGLAIHQIRAAEAVASPRDGAFNFSNWAVDIPVAALGELPVDETTGALQVPVVARDACEFEYTVAELPVVLPTPSFVEELTLTATPPSGETYLPSTVALPATIRVVAGGAAGGLPVTVTTSSGRLAGADEAGSTLVVPLMDTAPGRAEVLLQLTGTEPGELLVTAESDGHIDSKRLFVAGPPSFFPTDGQLLPGTTPVVDALTDGRFSQCEIQAPDEVLVRYEGLPVSGAITIDGQPGEDVRFQLEVDANLTENKTVTLLCRDTFGQAGSATFVAGP